MKKSEKSTKAEARLNKRIREAVKIGFEYGSFDGSHHKMWVIDQMLRKLLSAADYKAAIKELEKPDEYDDQYEWDVGVPP